MNRKRTRTLRMTVMAAVIILVVIGGVGKAGTGSLSAWGWGTIPAICPLGYLETALASRTIMPRLLISFLVIATLTVFLGRVFCGWVCPIPLVRKALSNQPEESQNPFLESAAAVDPAAQTLEAQEPADNAQTLKEHVRKKDFSLGLPVLGANLAASAIFGFPVFCLICPIGLVFATLFALLRLLQFNEPTIDLLVFPGIVVVELIFFKKWCSRWCPIGALLSLFSRFNRRLVPVVDRSLCLEESRGAQCQLCRRSCSIDIDLKKDRGIGRLSDCTKCGECADQCPSRAIRFLWKRSEQDRLE